MKDLETHAHVVSSTPGRLRVRFHRAHRSAHSMERAKDHLEQQDGVDRVDLNPATGSLTVKYDASQLSFDDVVAVMRDIGVVLGTAADLVIELPQASRSTTSISIITAIDDLDRRLSRLTGRKADLKLLFPAGLFALGIRQVLVEGLGTAQVPGYVLLWYAFDTFWKFHQERPVTLQRGIHAKVEQLESVESVETVDQREPPEGRVDA